MFNAKILISGNYADQGFLEKAHESWNFWDMVDETANMYGTEQSARYLGALNLLTLYFIAPLLTYLVELYYSLWTDAFDKLYIFSGF